MLDAEEYLHLAFHASAAREHHACMSYLKEALKLEPRNATAMYLLAVQHADLGLHARAIAGTQAALAIEPGMEAARFQLGWMLMDDDAIAESKAQFAMLYNSADLSMQSYARAMTALADKDIPLAVARLQEGLSRKSLNPGLTRVMTQLLERLSPPAAATPADSRSSHESIHLGAYGLPSR